MDPTIINDEEDEIIITDDPSSQGSNPITFDEEGRIIIDDSMSEELKEKIAEYNNFASGDSSDDNEDYSPEEIAAFEEELATDDSFDPASANMAQQVNQDDLNNLNDLFS